MKSGKYICIINKQFADCLTESGFEYLQVQDVCGQTVYVFFNNNEILEIAESEFDKSSYYFSNTLYF